jgi:oligosaccharide repeat unit polymerase
MPGCWRAGGPLREGARMMAAAVIAWAISLGILVAGLVLFLRQNRPAGVAVLVILLAQVHVRPVIFFLGLDTPYPYDYFRATEWVLTATASLTTAAWMVLFIAAYYALLPVAGVFAGAFPQAPARYSATVALFCTALVTALGFLATAWLVLRFGGLGPFIYAVKVSKALQGMYIVRELSVLAAILSLFLLVAHFSPTRRHKGALRPALTLLLCALLVVNLAVNYAWGNRYNIALLLFAAALAWHVHVHRISPVRALVVVLVMAALLQSLKHLRGSLVSDTLGRSYESGQSFWLDVSTSLHLNQFDAFMLALRDAGSRFELRFGADFWNGLVSWVPRSIMPERETHHIGRWFRKVYYPEIENGWPITVVGGWYVNFGPGGIPLGAAASALVAGAMDRAYRAARRNPWAAVAGAVIPFLMLDGGLGTGFPQAVFMLLIPLWLFTVALRLTAPGLPARAAPPPRASSGLRPAPAR